MNISIITPAYNAERYIGEAIQSVFNQTHKDWELIVVDDGSTDSTIKIVEGFHDPRIRLIRQPRNEGPASARLAGTMAAKHNMLSYLDSDDKLCPRALEVLSKTLTAHPDAILAYAAYVRIDEMGRRYGIQRFLQFLSKPSGNVLEVLLKRNILPNGGCALVRKKAVIESGCWNKSLRCLEDWAAWVQLALAGPFVYVPGFVALEYRELPSGLSQQRGKVYGNMTPAIIAVFNDPRITARYSLSHLHNLRCQQEAHIWAYMAMLGVRSCAWKDAFCCLWRSVFRSPRSGFRNVLKVVSAVLDVGQRKGQEKTGLSAVGKKLKNNGNASVIDAPKISVIIPVYNCAATIGKALQSIIGQTLSDIEIIVVDDASVDDTARVVSEFAERDKRIKLIKLEKNAGVGGASKVGVEVATGEWITKVDADDWCEPCRLEKMLEAANLTGADVVADNLQIYDHSVGKVIGQTKHGKGSWAQTFSAADVFNHDNPFLNNPLGYIKPLVKRKFLSDHNFSYLEQYRSHIDFAHLAELALSDAKIVIIPEAYYVYVRRVSPSTGKLSQVSRSGTDLPHLKIADYLTDKYGDKLSADVLQAMNRRRRRFVIFIAAKQAKEAFDNGQLGKTVFLLLKNPGVFVYAAILAHRRLYNKWLALR